MTGVQTCALPIYGNSNIPIWPKLANQQPYYITEQIKNFQKGENGNRFNTIMFEISQNLTDFNIKAISNNAGNQLELMITVKESDTETLQIILENFLEYNLTSKNSSKETTSSSLSADFYKQLIVAVLLAFFWMAAVVFLIFLLFHYFWLQQFRPIFRRLLYRGQN